MPVEIYGGQVELKTAEEMSQKVTKYMVERTPGLRQSKSKL